MSDNFSTLYIHIEVFGFVVHKLVSQGKGEKEERKEDKGEGRKGKEKGMGREKGWKERGRDLPDQCENAFYAPERVRRRLQVLRLNSTLHPPPSHTENRHKGFVHTGCRAAPRVTTSHLNEP